MNIIKLVFTCTFFGSMAYSSTNDRREVENSVKHEKSDVEQYIAIAQSGNKLALYPLIEKWKLLSDDAKYRIAQLLEEKEGFNDSMIQFKLCNIYRAGDGVSQDWKKAFQWGLRAAQLGNIDAQYNIGVFYGNGWGCERNLEQAVVWYRKAAERGHGLAQYCLGMCYLDGEGIPIDEKTSEYWLQASYGNGVMYAAEALSILKERQKLRK